MPRYPRLTVDKVDFEKIEQRLDALRAEARTTLDTERLARIESFITTLEAMLPVYHSFARLIEKLERIHWLKKR